MSDEKRCDCCQRYWYYDDLVSGLCPNCLDFLATKNLMDIEQDQKIKELKQQLADKEKKNKEAIKFIEEQKQQITDLEIKVGKRDIALSKMERKMGRFEQTAIAELEKVKDWLELKYFDKEQINYLANAIDQQIKSLKGD